MTLDGRPIARSRWISQLIAWVAIVTPLATALSTAPAQAVKNSHPAPNAAGEVIIFEDGRFVGTGTLVRRNWVLTAAHIFRRPDNPSIYTFRFGMTQANQANDNTLRTVTEIIPHATNDLVLIHFADPVPEATHIPTLATAAPNRFDPAYVYGWGPDGDTLNMVGTIVADPVANANLARLRAATTTFNWAFSTTIPPMVTNAMGVSGDVGGATFSPQGVLAGVHTQTAPFKWTNSSGNLFGEDRLATYDQPVWQILDWINEVTGATPPPPNDELRRRRLGEMPPPDTTTPSGDLPISLPPQDHICDSDATCDHPGLKATWARLVGPGSSNGTVLTKCVDVAGNTCAFGETTFEPGKSGSIRLGDVGETGIRNVLIWCSAKTSLAAGDPAGPVFRFSFINDDGTSAAPGFGLWDAATAQLTSDGSKAIDASTIDAC